MPSEEQRMLSGKLYNVYDKELGKKYERKDQLLHQINFPIPDVDPQAKLTELIGKMGQNCYIEPPFFCDFGDNITLGDDVYCNTNCIFLDPGKISIGSRVLIGPRVNLFAAGHPIDAGVRNKWLGFGKPITIGDNVWIGGGTTVNPGVTIGNNVVIGSGSVVTTDIPNNVVAVGNPCHVLRKITEQDKIYWQAEETDYVEDRGPLGSPDIQ
ncbi:sugar O-acetyltransferase [Lentilactobacillus hilgardii]|uniref:sugar O-acetyltransferase n=1 Tax=Lentilactobacillus hilgardii TaxID=1588 RepID=UPI0021A590DE|nr:sugar O-acetyltransferase [Lentilactobacillus hilgardii]MCT3398705.1 sugar O-acetyltransferase [Lentilactobacillus hilgardii]